jgi:hypothetical protein
MTPAKKISRYWLHIAVAVLIALAALFLIRLHEASGLAHEQTTQSPA